MVKSTFGKRLRIIRKEKNLTQADLGKLLEVSSSTIGMYEQERRDPDTDTVIKLADYFNVTTDWLLGISDVRHFYKREIDIPLNKYLLERYGFKKEDIDKVEEYIELIKLKYKA
jgi:transcriptional regulator with XRE-family HTH domain